MTLQLEYMGNADVPLEVEGILPETLRGQALNEIERAAVFHGNEPGALADFFRISGDLSDDCMVWSGDLTGVHWIGAKMTLGNVRIEGSAGRHVGSEMRGGHIEVSGNVSDWLGGEMHAGLIRVRGNAGHLVGSAYRGSARGVTGGTILIDGNAGNEIGHSMRRGLIAVGGDVGDLVGFNMLAGSIFVGGNSGIRHGAAMRRGTIGLLGPEPPPILPSFRRACRFQGGILRLVSATLKRYEMALADQMDVPVVLYNGDLIEGGRGELMIANGN
jgi:formylmethanofuran dehydrogenase subunit C